MQCTLFGALNRNRTWFNRKSDKKDKEDALKQLSLPETYRNFSIKAHYLHVPHEGP